MDKLDKAISIFEDETSPLKLGDRIAILGDALMWNVFETLKLRKKHGSKAPISEEAEYKHIECMKLYREMEKLYQVKVKANKASGKSEGQMDADFMKAIREMKSSVGAIVRDLKDGTNG